MNCKTILSILLLAISLTACCQTAIDDSLSISIDHYDTVTGLLRYSITNGSTHIIRLGRPKLEIAEHPGNLFVLQQTDSTAKRIFLTDASGRYAMFKKMMETIRHPIVIRPHRHIRRQVTINLDHSTAKEGASRICLLFAGHMMLYPFAAPSGTTSFTGRIVSNFVPAKVRSR